MLSLGSTQLEVGQQQQAGVLDEEVACVIATVAYRNSSKHDENWVNAKSQYQRVFSQFFCVQALESITSELKQHFQGVVRNSVLPCSSPHIEIAMASMDI